jgi:hypothetical protein
MGQAGGDPQGLRQAEGSASAKARDAERVFAEKGPTFRSPGGLAWDGIDYIFVADTGNSRIALMSDGIAASYGSSGEPGSALGQFRAPGNVSVGDRGILVADTANDRIQVFHPLADDPMTPRTPFVPRCGIGSEIGLKKPRAAAWAQSALKERFYIADTGNNRVLLVELPSIGPEIVWKKMKDRFMAGEIEEGLSYFSTLSIEGYRRGFFSLGRTAVIEMFSRIPPVQPVFVDGDSAQFRFDEMVDGAVITFPIQFIKENGVWKVLEF